MFDLDFRKDWRACLKDAAVWQLKIEEDQGVRGSSEFQDWARNELNWQAFMKLSSTWRSMEDHRDATVIRAIANDALSRLSRSRSRSISVPIGVWAGAVCACAVLLAIGLNFALRPQRPLADAPIVYSSYSNGLRTINLTDGSQIRLDARSSVTVHSFTSSSRDITLNNGRAQFSVAHDKTRPFSVTAGNEVVTAVGTAFDAERLDGKFLVTVTQGKVLERSVRPGGPSHEPVALVMGRQLVAARNGRISVCQVDLASETAWQKGKIVVDDQPLDETVERLNRYQNKQVIVDPAVANIKISGVFNVGDLPTFLSALTAAFPVQVHQKPGGQMVIEPRRTLD